MEFADGVRAAIFYEPGRLDDFETDTPGAFLIGKGTVHAADPTGRHSSFTLKLNGVSRKVPLPAGEFAGQNVMARFSFSIPVSGRKMRRARQTEATDT